MLPLQITSVGGPVFSLAWDERRRFLIVGGHSVIHIFKVSFCLALDLHIFALFGFFGYAHPRPWQTGLGYLVVLTHLDPN